MTKSQIRKVQELLEEREAIVKMTDRNEDKIYLRGMEQLLFTMGYEYIHTTEGIKVLPL